MNCKVEGEESLTKENFWEAQEQATPKATKELYSWIDGYKKREDFTGLFNQGVHGRTVTPKYHQLPIAFQIGMFMEFIQDVQIAERIMFDGANILNFRNLVSECLGALEHKLRSKSLVKE